MAQIRSVLSLGQTGTAANQGTAAERAEGLLRLLSPYRGLLSRPLSQGVPRHGEQVAEAVTRLVLAVAWERGVAVPASGAAGTLIDW